jgi:hypothetical protein
MVVSYIIGFDGDQECIIWNLKRNNPEKDRKFFTTVEAIISFCSGNKAHQPLSRYPLKIHSAAAGAYLERCAAAGAFFSYRFHTKTSIGKNKNFFIGI